MLILDSPNRDVAVDVIFAHFFTLGKGFVGEGTAWALGVG